LFSSLAEQLLAHRYPQKPEQGTNSSGLSQGAFPAIFYYFGMFAQLLDLFFPRVSLKGDEGMLMTEQEFLSLVSFPVRVEEAALRADGLQFLDRIVAASSYEASPLLRSAVHRFKYGRQQSYARELGTILAEASTMIVPSYDLTLCPVPLHWSRAFSRGFNQSDLLADAVSEERGWPVVSLLKRRRATGHQAHRSHADRRDALHEAFVLRRETLPLHVVLIDDIATTGSTLDACAEVLKMAGVEYVEALVIAKG
jgi:ComF family protein